MAYFDGGESADNRTGLAIIERAGSKAGRRVDAFRHGIGRLDTVAVLIRMGVASRASKGPADFCTTTNDMNGDPSNRY